MIDKIKNKVTENVIKFVLKLQYNLKQYLDHQKLLKILFCH